MARRKRNRPEQRDHSSIARTPAVRFVPAPLVSDRRLFHPERPFAPVYSPRKSQRALVEGPKYVSRVNRNKVGRAGKSADRYKVAFAVPRKVELCVRRHQRREVLFALRRTGKGARKVQRRRNFWTGVSCK